MLISLRRFARMNAIAYRRERNSNVCTERFHPRYLTAAHGAAQFGPHAARASFAARSSRYQPTTHAPPTVITPRRNIPQPQGPGQSWACRTQRVQYGNDQVRVSVRTTRLPVVRLAAATHVVSGEPPQHAHSRGKENCEPESLTSIAPPQGEPTAPAPSTAAISSSREDVSRVRSPPRLPAPRGGGLDPRLARGRGAQATRARRMGRSHAPSLVAAAGQRSSERGFSASWPRGSELTSSGSQARAAQRACACGRQPWPC